MLHINAETFDFRLRVINKFLLFHLLLMNYDKSVYQSVGKCLYFSVLNLISQGHFVYMYLYITSYQGNREDMNGNKEIYSVLKFTVVCHVIVLLLAVLQWH